jgi:hypothetical protein
MGIMTASSKDRSTTNLSKQLNKHEVHYWPTELEIAGIVWSVQKLRHLIEGFAVTKVITDHKPAADILMSKTLKTSSSVRQNLRLIRASQFISPNLRSSIAPARITSMPTHCPALCNFVR